jgi:hypothetical protein
MILNYFPQTDALEKERVQARVLGTFPNHLPS